MAKNIQIIDNAQNGTFEIFEILDQDFLKIFPKEDQEIEFGEDFFDREPNAEEIWARLWEKRVDRLNVQGIHGTLFCGAPERKQYFKSKKWDD